MPLLWFTCNAVAYKRFSFQCLQELMGKCIFMGDNTRLTAVPYRERQTRQTTSRHPYVAIAGISQNMPYSSMLLYVNLDSLAARREDLPRRFFRDIMDPVSWLHSLLPPPRSTAITSIGSDLLKFFLKSILVPRAIVHLYNMVLTTTSKPILSI